MSRLTEIRDSIKTRIQESESFQQMQDRYQSLTPTSQKLVWAAGIFLVALLILFEPLSQISTSNEMIASFEEKRTLIRNLFKTYHEATGQASIPVPPPAPSLRAQIDSILEQANLLPEQRIGIMEAGLEEKSLIPSSLVSTIFEVKLSKLNLKQIVDIGSSLVGISDSVKMKDLAINANPKDTRYYDVSYKLYSLKVPEPLPPPPIEVEKPKKGSSTKSNADKKKDEGD